MDPLSKTSPERMEYKVSTFQGLLVSIYLIIYIENYSPKTPVER